MLKYAPLKHKFLKIIFNGEKMRAEHRHELKTNELAEWLFNLPDWAQKNLRTIIYVTVVVVLVLGTFFYQRYQKTVVAAREQAAVTGLIAQIPMQESQIAEAASQGTDASYTLLQAANELKNFAQNSRQEAIKALALVKEAQILRAELQFRQGAITKQDIESQVNKAKDDYNEALTYLKKTPDCPLEAMARFGLGLCEEDLGNYQQAKTMYKEVAQDSRFDGTIAAAAAKYRLETMDYYINTKIALKPAPPVPVPPPAPAAEQPLYGPRRSLVEPAPATVASPAKETPEANAPAVSLPNPPAAK
jgi:tetratricopeptide (TPR) repeat protein